MVQPVYAPVGRVVVTAVFLSIAGLNQSATASSPEKTWPENTARFPLRVASSQLPARPLEPTKFQYWCQRAETLSKPTQNLVKVMLRAARTQDCRIASLRLHQLPSLRLVGQFNDLRPLATLKQLKTLDLTITDGRGDLTELTELSQLQSLDLSGDIPDLQPLTQLPRLTSLRLSSPTLTKISILGKMRHLRELDLSVSQVRGNYCELAKLRQLRSLKLNATELTSLAFLRAMTQLESLSLIGSRLTNIVPIGQLRRLRMLALPDSPIRDIRPLVKLKQLRQIDLRQTAVQDFSPLNLLPNLVELKAGKIVGSRCPHCRWRPISNPRTVRCPN